MAEGRSNAAIAAGVVTDRAVETHVTGSIGKLGLEASGENHGGY